MMFSQGVLMLLLGVCAPAMAHRLSLREFLAMEGANAPQPVAMAPRAVQQPAQPVQPVLVQAVPAAQPAPVAVAQPQVGAENPSGAFVQLKELQMEFEQISANDQAHMRKLLFNVQLREVLKKKLQAELDHLEDDNRFLQGAILKVKEMEAAERSNQPISDDTSKALLQLKKQLGAQAGKSSEEIAHEILTHMQSMAGEVNQIRANDEHEVASLIANSQARTRLERTIEQQKAKLDSDSGVLLKDLSKIASLAEVTAPAPQAAPAQLMKQEKHAMRAPVPQPLAPLPPTDDALPPLPPVDGSA